LYVQALPAQSRTTINLISGWQFTKDPQVTGTGATIPGAKWEPVQLPHSWNTLDVMDDEPGYYRGPGWYRKKLVFKPSDKGKPIYLRFEGANQSTEIYINGSKAESHTGGYTAFQFPIHPWLHFDGRINELLVKVDNSYNADIPPLTADFTFFGGLYRDAWLITLEPVHFTMDDNGSNGVFISTPQVSEENAKIQLKGVIINTQSTTRRIHIDTRILDRTGKQIKLLRSTELLQPGSRTVFNHDIPSFANPRLWSPDDPYLYTVTSTIVDAQSGKMLDVVTNPLGFRWFQFDADKGFFLNGKSFKLIGASRHQDRPGMGNAVPDKLAVEDVTLLKKMGGNFLRVAHYPQDPDVIEACDRLGLLASVEIPVVNEITESEDFYRHCDTMLVEMIRQQYNHPSIIVWCYMNEVLLRLHFNDDKERQKIYISNVTRLARRLDSIVRKEDPYRYTMIANHGDFDRYHNAGLTDIPMIVGWNLYSGWYGGQLENFPAFLDKHHQQLPSKPVVVSEYGADADPRIRSLHPVKFDKSVEYSLRFHQYYLQEILKRPFVSGGMIWNLADFNSETREETMPHMNNKGLLMWDRTPKDLYYFYQANLTKTPFVKIASSYWTTRTGIADPVARVCYQPLQVATNLDSVQLIVNGKAQGWKKPAQGICEWKIPFVNNLNNIEAKGILKGKNYNDHIRIHFLLQPYHLQDASVPFKEMNILLGADRFFLDKTGNRIWQPDQPYRTGSWGSIGGQPFKISGNTRLPYGSDKNITGTDNDPIYQTQQTGITAYRLDLPNGEYEVSLHFAELQGVKGKDLVYNLSDSSKKDQSPHRRFNVYVNNVRVLENFDIAAQYGPAIPVIKKHTLSIKDGEGIQISFKAVEGEPVLNAIRVRRMR
jgi:beta-galactosidase